MHSATRYGYSSQYTVPTRNTGVLITKEELEGGRGGKKERILNTFEQNREAAAAAAVSLLVCARGTIEALPPPSILETH